MVDIEFKPLKKILVVEARRYATPEDLARAVSLQSEPPHYVKWCNGWAFKPYPTRYVNTEIYAREFMDGTMYTSIDYAKMSEFKSTLKGSVEGNAVAVIDDSLSVHSVRITEWLNRHKPEIPEFSFEGLK